MIPIATLPNKINLTSLETIHLENGIPVYFIKNTSQDILEIQFVFEAGSIVQDKPLQARITAEMLFEGTSSYDSAQISELFDYYGSFPSSETTKDYTTVSLFLLNQHIDSLFPVLSEVIKNPNFKEENLNQLLVEHKQEFLVNIKKNSYLARNEYANLLFGNNNFYGKKVTLADFDKLTISDIQHYFQSYLTSKNCKIFLTGNVTDEVLKKLELYFGKNHWNNWVEKEVDIFENKNKIEKHLEVKDSLQTAIKIGGISIGRKHPDFHHFIILNTILGGYFGSRLMTNIREEKGYTYGISSSIVTLRKSSYFSISTEVKGDVSELAVKEVYIELNKLQNELVSENEMTLVKNYLIGGLLRSIDGPFNLMERWKSMVLNNQSVEDFNSLVFTLNHVTPIEILNVAQKYYVEDNMIQLTVGRK
jgi:zinc protease